MYSVFDRVIAEAALGAAGDAETLDKMDAAVADGTEPDPVRAGTVEKCTLCNHRLEEGREPACVEGCPARALTFGDLNDPDSRASQLLSERAYETLLPDAGTSPNTYYLL